MRQLLHDPKPDPIAETAAEQPESGKVPHSTLPNRWADGTQRPGAEGIARKHPKLAADSAAVQQWLREKSESHIADRGGRDNLTTAVTDACGELAFAKFALDQWKQHFIEKGLTTPRGRVRSAYASYLSTLDRYIRLAQMIGLERRARKTQTPAEWLAGLDERGNAEGTGDDQNVE